MEKVLITKYALTRGIIEKEVDINGDTAIGKAWDDYYYGEGKDWHRTKESALKKAEEMRVKKIGSLKKQIKKLENMKFV